MGSFAAFDVALLVAYMAGVTLFGTWLGRRQKDARDYFLADRSIPWWAVCFSVIATETSVLTFISVPATAYTSDLWMVQLAFGYLIGRIAVAAILLPGYFRGELDTAYALLERRFGPLTRRFASLIFLVTRSLGSSVRLFASAIPLKLVTGLPYWQAIVLTGVVTLVYTYFGGLRAVVWVDVVQMVVFLGGAVAAVVALLGLLPHGWHDVVSAAETTHKLRIVHWSGGFADPKWIATGVVGGAFLSMASHGVDHVIVQRLLAARSLGDARKALVASGVAVLAMFSLFLFAGAGLFAFYHGRAFATPDEIFPRFIVEGLPAGIGGLVIAGIFSVAMSSEAGALNSLASALTHDLYVPLTGRDEPEHVMRVGRRFTLLAGAVLIGGAILFQLAAKDTPIVVVALQIASFTYGGLLGGFLLGIASRRADGRDAVTGMAIAIAAMALLWAAQQFGAMPKLVDTLWFSLVGSAVTVAAGTLSSRLRARAAR
ncbi:MAG TPA: sodium:solute symporter [Longimicrobiaceae bacterium]|jgi:SSS family transporter|nr:sodium:solute symporter [Longimicrobiaceae bacterium]